jgi:hypothetical protein
MGILGGVRNFDDPSGVFLEGLLISTAAGEVAAVAARRAAPTWTARQFQTEFSTTLLSEDVYGGTRQNGSSQLRLEVDEVSLFTVRSPAAHGHGGHELHH